MIKLFLKHMVSEHAINTLFNRVGINFISRSDKIRKVILKRFHSFAQYERQEPFATVIYEIGKFASYHLADGTKGRGHFKINEIKIDPPVRSTENPTIRFSLVSTYTKNGRLIDSGRELFETMSVEY